MAESNEGTYAEVSYAMIGDKKYKVYVGPDGKWYKREILKTTVEECKGYFRPVFELGEFELY